MRNTILVSRICVNGFARIIFSLHWRYRRLDDPAFENVNEKTIPFMFQRSAFCGTSTHGLAEFFVDKNTVISDRHHFLCRTFDQEHYDFWALLTPSQLCFRQTVFREMKTPLSVDWKLDSNINKSRIKIVLCESARSISGASSNLLHQMNVII